MALLGSRLEGEIYNDTKTELLTKFGGFKTGLLATEQTAFDDAIDKLAQAIAAGDATNTVTEIKDNAKVNPGTLAITPTLILDSTTNPCSGDGSVNNGQGTIE